MLVGLSDYIMCQVGRYLPAHSVYSLDVFIVGELLRQESDRQSEMAVSTRSGLSRKKVLRRRRTSDHRGGSKRPSVTDHPHGASSKQVTPVKRVPLRGVLFMSVLLLHNFISTFLPCAYYHHHQLHLGDEGCSVILAD